MSWFLLQQWVVDCSIVPLRGRRRSADVSAAGAALHYMEGGVGWYYDSRSYIQGIAPPGGRRRSADVTAAGAASVVSPEGLWRCGFPLQLLVVHRCIAPPGGPRRSSDVTAAGAASCHQEGGGASVSATTAGRTSWHCAAGMTAAIGRHHFSREGCCVRRTSRQRRLPRATRRVALSPWRSVGFLYYSRPYIVASRRREGGGVLQTMRRQALSRATWRVA